MNTAYHVLITQEALGDRFEPQDLAVVVRANLGQDSIPNLIKHPEIHFDDSRFAAGEHYIEQQRRQAVQAALAGDRELALQALGRLLHSRQDFYAHSNWVRLWVEAQGGLDHCSPGEVEICPDWRAVPQLISGTASAWRYLIYRIPLLGQHVKRFYLPANSHEAMNLDHPGQGPLFPFAVVAATKHTRWELELMLRAIATAGGQAAAMTLLGTAAPKPTGGPIEL